jgi:hypothetical protein
MTITNEPLEPDVKFGMEIEHNIPTNYVHKCSYKFCKKYYLKASNYKHGNSAKFGVKYDIFNIG